MASESIPGTITAAEWHWNGHADRPGTHQTPWAELKNLRGVIRREQQACAVCRKAGVS